MEPQQQRTSPKLGRFLPLVVFLGLAVAFGLRLTHSEAQQQQRSGRYIYIDPMLGKQLPDFSLSLVIGEGELTQEAFHKGKPRLLNVMASWCAPCRVEHPLLRDYAVSRRVPVYGIAWKDKPEDTRRFLEQNGNIYADVASDEKGQAAIALGLTGVPETYLVDGTGRIVAVYRGMLTQEILEGRFDSALAELQGTQP